MPWVFTVRVPPPHNKTISVRYGSSICFAAYSPWAGWYMADTNEKLAPPPLWFSNDPEHDKLAAELQEPPLVQERVSLRRSKKPQQQSFKF